MYAASVILRRWLWPLKWALETLEENVALQVDIPGLSHIPVGRSLME
jgi:hypothetical protein